MRISYISRYSAVGIGLFSAFMILGAMVRKVNLNQVFRDQGVFFYTAIQILEGKMPYLNSWDHKGPFTYILEAIWILIAQGPQHAALVEFCALLVSVFLFVFVVAQKIPHPLMVILPVTCYSISLGLYHESWGVTETLTIPLVLFGGVLLIIQSSGKRLQSFFYFRIADFVLGSIVATLLFVRPTNALGFCFFSFSLRMYFSKNRSKTLLWYFSGSICLIVCTIFWIYSNGALSKFWQQYILFNFYYSTESSMVTRILSFRNSLPILFFFIIFAVIFLKNSKNEAKLNFLIIASGVAIFLDCLGASLSGHGFRHYFVVPATTSFLCSMTLLALLNSRSQRFIKRYVLVLTLVLIVVAIIQNTQASNLSSQNQYASIAQYIQNHTNKTDKVYVYGAETGILAFAGRESSSSITYLYPVTSRFFPLSKVIEAQLLRDLENSPPVLLIARISTTCDLNWTICPEDSPIRSENNAVNVREFLRNAYFLSATVGDYRIYSPRAP